MAGENKKEKAFLMEKKKKKKTCFNKGPQGQNEKQKWC